jgi:uncharacterized SAM-binding protein YcdF (DUF218 family)
MFMLGKILAPFFYPVALCLEILLLGLLCLWATRKPRLGKMLVTFGTLLLLLLSSGVIASGLLHPLEYRYPALLHPEEVFQDGKNRAPSPRWIVVLGGGHVSDPRLPPNSQIRAAALGRVVEGVRLYRALPGCKLLFSGGRLFDPVPEADVMARIAVSLGVPPQDIVTETESRNTAAQAASIAKMLGPETMILVTSAVHMPRSMALFRQQGLQPIPGPADHLAPEGHQPHLSRFFPQAESLKKVQAAIHEYLGLAWAWLRGEISRDRG